MQAIVNLAQGCLVGALVGDAAGARLEFLGRRPAEQELADSMAMQGGGVWRVAPGQVTDDGELTMALARALCNSPSFPREDVAASYLAWMDSCPFDVGHATSAALGTRRISTGSLADEISRQATIHNMDSKANGALMRASALGIWATRLSALNAAKAAQDDAGLTHPNPTCLCASAAYVVAIRHLLLNPGDAQGAFAQANEVLQNMPDRTSEEVLGWLHESEQGDLPSGYPSAGFVRVAFTHAFHHMLRESSYIQALHETLALGGDTDTNACIVGGLVGSRVGISGIPAHMTRAVLDCDTSNGRPRPPWLSTKDALDVAHTLLLGK